MFTKLIAIVLAAGLVAVSLLVVRQRRLDLAHESSRIHRHMQELEPLLWELEAGIARRCRPEDVKLALADLHETWIPIPDRVSTVHQVDFALVENTPPRERTEG